jgi:hypothetical protein
MFLSEKFLASSASRLKSRLIWQRRREKSKTNAAARKACLFPIVKLDKLAAPAESAVQASAP